MVFELDSNFKKLITVGSCVHLFDHVYGDCHLHRMMQPAALTMKLHQAPSESFIKANTLEIAEKYR